MTKPNKRTSMDVILIWQDHEADFWNGYVQEVDLVAAPYENPRTRVTDTL
ncbi:hypothetical protein LCGC14_1282630 [marine sediment metagenome]|uniref:Uncharacterized protein n=1 Tax=marine sediment metagenome TaxID=412755 RepID=A0A0F9KUS0_9ZZZZ